MSSALPTSCIPRSSSFCSQFSGTNTLHGPGSINQVGIIHGNAYFDRQTTPGARKNFFLWLKQWIGNIDFKKDHQTILQKRYKDTGNWFLKHPQFQYWVESNSSSVLWGLGSPGIGKSVLASIVIDHLQKRNATDHRTVVAFVYFKHDSQGSQLPTAIIASFIKQICVCLRNVPIPNRLMEFYHTADETTEEPSTQEFVEELQFLGNIFERVFIIVDALDECRHENRETILDFLFAFAKVHTCAKILFTSRDEKDIRDYFSCQVTPVIHIQVDNISADIETYVEGHIDDLLKGKKLSITSESLKKKVIAYLTEKAQGMFLWVNLQLNQLCKHRRDIDVDAELDRLPAGLNNTYQRIMDQIEELPDPLRVLACRSLTWVFYSVRPLSINELVEATAVDSTCITRDDLEPKLFPPDAILDACSNLLVIEDNFIRALHFLAQEYFTQTRDISSGTNLSLVADQSLGHTEISLCCLRYLMLSVFWVHAETAKELLNRVTTNSLAPYAAYFFDVHISRLDRLSPQLIEYIKVFLRYRNISLKSVFQLRRFQGYKGSIHRRKVFLDMDYEIGPEDIIVASSLYKSKQLQQVDSKWEHLKIPRFALHRAAEEGKPDEAQSLIDSGQAIDELDYYGLTPLFYACYAGFIDVAIILLNSRAEVDTICENDETALYTASAQGHFVLVRMLIESGARINIKAGKHGNALCAAIIRGHDAVVQLLLRYGANPCSVDELNNSAVSIASDNGKGYIVKLLISKGASMIQEVVPNHNEIVEVAPDTKKNAQITQGLDLKSIS